MATEHGFNLKEIIDLLKLSRPTGEPILYKDWTEVELENNHVPVFRKDDFKCELQWQKVKLYDMDASDFLSFAKQDVKEDSERGRTNALSNAKRAIECRVDECLALFNFKVFSLGKKWNLPYKMQVLQTFGVRSPDILRRLIISKRNILEHKYGSPQEPQEVEDAVELAELFLEASRPYIERGYIASAMLTYDTWFKPGLLAPSWFGMGIGKYTGRKYEYHDGFRSQYKLEFNLNEATITLAYSWVEVFRRCDLKTGEVIVRGSKYEEKRPRAFPKEEKGPYTIPIRECEMEEIRELMTLLREKGKEA